MSRVGEQLGFLSNVGDTLMNMNIFDFLKSFFGKNPYYTGVNPDDRYSAEKNKDYRHEERAFGMVVNPYSNPQITESPYPYENQQYTSSCVPHGVGLALAITRKMADSDYARLSYMFNYRMRSNYSQEGCYLQEQFDTYRKVGAPLFTSLPDTQTEAQANAVVLTPQMYTEAAIFKGLTYYTIGTMNGTDVLANISAQGKAIAILIYGLQDEWGREFPLIEDPSLPLNASTEIRHCVCILPHSGFMLNGIKYLTVQDSAWFGGKKLRHLSEDWIKTRVYGAMYWDSVTELSNGPRPVFTFTKVLRYGSTGLEVQVMQQLLISEGLLPSDCMTGNFYGRTLAGVHAFQNKYKDEILTPLGLDTPTDIFGSACIAKANKLCGQPS